MPIWIEQQFDTLKQMIAARDLTLLLGGGVVLLTLALLVMTRTRWGQAKPVTKCIFLSVLAHVLLIGYAWGTHFVLALPQQPAASTRVSILSAAPVDLPADEPLADSNQAEQLPWQSFDSEGEIQANQGNFAPAHETEIRPEILTPLPKTQAVPVDVTAETVILPPDPVAEELPAEKIVPVAARPEFSMPQQEMPGSESADNIETLESSEPSSPTIQAAQVEIERKQAADAEDPLAKAADDPQPPPRLQPELTPAIAANHQDQPQQTEADRVHASQLNHQVTDQVRVAQLPGMTTDQPQLKSDDDSWRQPQQLDLVSLARSQRRMDGSELPRMYEMRAADNRLQRVLELGGSQETEQAVLAALKWLAANQQSDGRWNPRLTEGGQEQLVLGHHRGGAGTNADTGITGLALLAFLAAGHTHQQGDYQDVVRKGLDFLVARQRQNGNLSGDARLYAQTYCHSMALFALAEALAMSGDSRLMPAVKSGVAYSLGSQNQQDGGWRYQPGDAGDMSQFGWKVMAFKAAQAGGVDVPDATIAKMKRFLQLCSRGTHGGLASYRPGEQTSVTMTSEALVCRYFLVGDVSDATREEAVQLVRRALPQSNQVNFYYWYYGNLAMFHAGGRDWQRWNEQLSGILVASQVQAGKNAGSWAPVGQWSGYGGRVYSTAMATLCLEVYYRYLSGHREQLVERDQAPRQLR